MNRSSIIFLCLAAALLGGLLGLGALQGQAPPSAAPATAGTALAYRLLEPNQIEVPRTSSGGTKPVTIGENFSSANGPLREDAFEIVVPPGGWVEYKAVMARGAALVYTWKAQGGDISYDFHADLPDSDTGFFTRYRNGDDSQGSGSIVAPYEGLHGWYWKNHGDETAVIELEVAGFYAEIRTSGEKVASAR